MMGMIIFPANVTFRVLGSRSRSFWLFLEKKIVITLAPTFIDRFQYNLTQLMGMIVS